MSAEELSRQWSKELKEAARVAALAPGIEALSVFVALCEAYAGQARAKVRERLGVTEATGRTLTADEQALPPYMTAAEVAKLTGYSVATVHQHADKIGVRPDGISRHRFPRERVIAWMEAKRPGNDPVALLAELRRRG